ncbi:MAG: SDR family NAD(P)-dependent oxidoreductase [Kiloniellales bacterium]
MTYRSALVTGASSGIGAAIAAELPAETGLVLTGQDQARLEAVKASLPTDARTVESVVANLAEDSGRNAVIERARAAAIDLLVCNAGLGRLGRVVDNKFETERQMVEVNVVATVVLTRALLPGMIERAREDGRRAGVIIVSSVAGFLTLPYFATYSASKAFDLHYAEALAGELAQEPVDVLALCPGATKTAFGERAGMPSKLFDRADTATRVAREALAALGRRTVHVVGAGNRLNTIAPRLLPRNVVTKGAARMLRHLSRAAKP